VSTPPCVRRPVFVPGRVIADESPEAEAPAEAWAVLLPGQEFVVAYMTSLFAAQYRVIVDVLLAEQDTSLTGLSYDEGAAATRAHLVARVPEDVVDRLLARHSTSRPVRVHRSNHISWVPSSSAVRRSVDARRPDAINGQAQACP
jgi:hypothetical protein